MVLPQSLGHEARKADWHEEGRGSHCPEDRRNLALHMGRRHIVRLGAGEGGLILFASCWSGLPDWRCPAGTVVVATSVIRLVAARPHFAANVEAPDPDIIMRRSRPRKG